MASAPVLMSFDPLGDIFVTTDASKYAIGSVLEQKDTDNPRSPIRPVAFYSRTMNPAEQNYAPHESELLAIIDTLRVWRAYLHGRRFTVYTDHYPLRYLQTQKNLSQRQIRWLELIVSFDFVITPIKGKTNVVADALSRKDRTTSGGSELAGDLLRRAVQRTSPPETNAVSLLSLDPKLSEGLAQEYKDDKEFSQQYRSPKKPFTVENHLLYYRGRLCVPKGKFRESLLYESHDVPQAGHLGVKKTFQRLSPRYYWKGMQKYVHDYVTSCDICQRTKSTNHKPFGLLQPLEPPTEKWTHITMDFIKPLPKSKDGNCGVFVVVDRLSKMVRVAPFKKEPNAVEAAKLFLELVYRHHGLPLVIICDRDPVFMGLFWKAVFKALGTRITPSSAYHPQTDGQTEILNRKLEEMIRCFVSYDQTDWDKHLIHFEVAYNSAVHSATTFTPFFLTYGQNPRILPLETLESKNPSSESYLKTIQESTKNAIKAIQKSNEAMEKHSNKKRLPANFQVNDKVLLSTRNLKLEEGAGIRKLSPKFCGPFEITEKVNEVTYRLNLSQPMIDRGIHNAFHASLLKPYTEDKFRRQVQPPPPLRLDDGTEEYEVEKILGTRKNRGKRQYLVKWLGYPDHENTWLDSKDLTNCKDLVKQFERK